VIPFIIVIVVFGAVIAIGVYAEKKTTQAFKDFAAANDLSFVDGPDRLTDRYWDFSLFERGNRRKVKRAFEKTVGENSVIYMHYYYTTGRGESRSTHNFTLVAVNDSSLNLPHFFARKQHKILDSIGKIFGGKDIDYPEDELFSSGIVLQGKEIADTREFFDDAPFRSAVFSSVVQHHAEVEGRGTTVIVAFPGSLKAEQFFESSAVAVELAKRFKGREKAVNG
jgi:hypothetical protein